MKHSDLTNFPKLAFLIPILNFTNGYIAGGAFKNIFQDKKIKDVDVFYNTKEDYEKAHERIKTIVDNSDKYRFVYENDNVYCYHDKSTGLNVELIHKEFNNPENEIKTFDFTITKFAVYLDDTAEESKHIFEKVKVVYHDDFFEHLTLNRLVIDEETLEYPLGTFNRVLRYTKYGFNLCRESKRKLIQNILNLEGIVSDEELGLSFYTGKD